MRDHDNSQASLGRGAGRSSGPFIIIEYLTVLQQSIHNRLACMVDEEGLPTCGKSPLIQLVTVPTKEITRLGHLVWICGQTRI